MVLALMTVCSSVFGVGPATKPVIVTAAEWGSTPQPLGDDQKQSDPKFITIHHAGSLWTIDKDPAKVVKAIQAYGQKEKNWPDLPYHFLIAPDGRIFEGRPLAYAPQSNTKYELAGNIGIELMGNFEVQRPSVEQVRACVKLSAWLAQDYGIDPATIRGHKDAAKDQTVCPGKDFYRYLKDGEFVGWVKTAMQGNEPTIDLGPPLEGGPTTRITETKK